MHIVECAFECGGFDVALMRGGMSPQVWHLAREFAAQGHRVSILTPAHGALDYLSQRYPLQRVDYTYSYAMPIVLDPSVWLGFPEQAVLSLCTTAHRLTLDGVDVYYLSNEYLDLLPDKLYPPASSEGRDLSFVKSLVF